MIQELQHVVLSGDIELVGRRTKDKPRRRPRSGRRLAQRNVSAEVTSTIASTPSVAELRRIVWAVGRCRSMKTARDAPRLRASERQGPRAGKKIDGNLAFDCVAEKIEEGLSNPVFHWPSAQIARILQFPPAKLAANNPHPNGSCRVPAAGHEETCLSAVSFVLPSTVPLCQICCIWYGMGRGTDSGESVLGRPTRSVNGDNNAASSLTLRVSVIVLAYDFAG